MQEFIIIILSDYLWTKLKYHFYQGRKVNEEFRNFSDGKVTFFFYIHTLVKNLIPAKHLNVLESRKRLDFCPTVHLVYKKSENNVNHKNF
jgi:hypothetical protein